MLKPHTIVLNGKTPMHVLEFVIANLDKTSLPKTKTLLSLSPQEAIVGALELMDLTTPTKSKLEVEGFLVKRGYMKRVKNGAPQTD